MISFAIDSTPNRDRFPKIPELSAIIEALEGFQDFQPNTRDAAFRFYASQIAVQFGWQREMAEFHLRAIALYAGLGGES